jgi:hypothetical protein
MLLEDSSTKTLNQEVFMKKLMRFLIPILSLAMSSCTLSVTTLHTQGTASDVVDENQAPNTQVNPNVSVPIAPLK